MYDPLISEPSILVNITILLFLLSKLFRLTCNLIGNKLTDFLCFADGFTGSEVYGSFLYD